MKETSSVEIILNFRANNHTSKKEVEKLIKDIIIENPCISPLFDSITIENKNGSKYIKKSKNQSSIS